MKDSRLELLDVYDDQIAEMYTQVVEAGYHPQKEYVKELLNIIKGGDCILELGCGTGDTLIPLQEKGIFCYGIDKSSSMLYRLKSRNANVNTFLGDVRNLDLVGDYDYVVSCNGVFSIKGNELESYLLDEEEVNCCLKKYSKISRKGILISKDSEKEALRLPLNGKEYVHREVRERDMNIMIHLLFDNRDFKGIKTHVKRRYPLDKVLESSEIQDFSRFRLIRYK